MSDQFTGHGGAADHRTTGERAWCHGCTEWCYPHEPCGQPRCCAEMTADRVELEQALMAVIAERDALLHVAEAAKAWRDELVIPALVLTTAESVLAATVDAIRAQEILR